MSKTWAKCLNTLKDTLPLAIFSVWVQPLKAIEDESNLSLLAPSTSVKNYVNKNLKQEIKSVIAQHNKNLKIYIGVATQSGGKTKTQKQHNTPLFPEYTFDNLVLGNANQIAYGATRQIAENIKSSPYNPFIIYGSSGLGKTHLMQAAGHLAKEKDPSIKVIYVPLMDFVKNITTSLRHNTIEDIKAYYQSADLLLVDDIHLIAKKENLRKSSFIFSTFCLAPKNKLFLLVTNHQKIYAK
jgi:chromosomal replication initiator protein DnaA